MGVILAWFKAHFAISKLFNIGKGGYELLEARSNAIKAGVEARMLTRQEALANLELQMHKLDGKVRAQYGYSVRIVDPNVYVKELKVEPDLVTQVLMRRCHDMALAQAHFPSRWKRNW